MKNNDFKVSVIIPILNEEGNIDLLSQNIVAVLKEYSDYEVLFVDDGSNDNTLTVIQKQRSQNGRIHYLSFSRNFGHQNALRAGFDYVSGDCVISMDGDMQHPPAIIPQLIEKWQEGYDIVYTIRKDDPRGSFVKRKTADMFYYVMNQFSDIKLEKGVADFRLLDKSVVGVIKTITENSLFMRGLISWLGFKQFGIAYMPEERHSGESKYTLSKMIKFAIIGITSFSLKPLHISTVLGYIIASLSFLYGIYAIGAKLFTNSTISGWTSVLTVILFIGGIQLIMIGILGEYIGKLFVESKKRPNYIIRERSL
jgi:polyisoprenyl-phosphate glycosyltransferase